MSMSEILGPTYEELQQLVLDQAATIGELQRQLAVKTNELTISEAAAQEFKQRLFDQSMQLARVHTELRNSRQALDDAGHLPEERASAIDAALTGSEGVATAELAAKVEERATQRLDAIGVALRELVRLKDIKEQIELGHASDATVAEYLAAKDPAWRAAREALL